MHTMKAGILYLALLFFLISSLWSCGATGENTRQETFPEWVNRPGSVYDERVYMMAVGNSDSFERAREAAMVNLAGRFLSEIDSEQNLYRKNVSYSDDRDHFESLTETLVQNTNIRTAEDLENVEILETWHSREQDQFFALAGLNRRESIALISDEVERNHQQIISRHEQYNMAERIHHKLGLLSEIQQFIYANLELLRQKRILSGFGLETSEAYEYESKLEEYAHFRRQLSFRIQGNAHDKVINRIRHYMNDFGLTLTDNPADIEIVIREDIAPTDLGRNEMEFIQWYLLIDIYTHVDDTGERIHLDQLAFSARTGALSFQEARNRARFEMVQDINSEFIYFLENNIFR